ncbi:Stp1/IreP family PP2C-type Ser/Thr phosphatase [Paenibacillus pinistramenti]|uniref:Stp1/IreP family PP2C-type Ser/Thr phosphatase n=1 Tax=Paenibacillus pinistramenti TaxID=1768003 RepID=UPI001108493A|nr:Stp1/IreP family PP2C-type Ser/Thr phosphatase [Paenibacillus pinistramenti]
MINSVSVTNIGHIRSVNEDSFSVVSLEQGYTLGIVADGMGGHQAGDTASRLAVETITADLFEISPHLNPDACGIALKEAILHANKVIYETASAHEELRSMGTTVVAVLLGPSGGVIGHIGDSRAYKFKHGTSVQLTEDHTLVNELVKSKQISAEEASVHPRRNIIMRALGTDASVEVDLYPVTLEEEEILMVCSDGLSSYVPAQDINRTLGLQGCSLRERAERLVSLALDAGGEDNITVVLLELQPDTPGSGTKELSL